ncbi:MAG: NAD(P)/FAD-dependent oxidoreductase [Patescibacteria group bacterium]
MKERTRLQPTGEIDVGIIGGGVIGLSVARVLAHPDRQIVVFEAETAIGMHTSSRNSEVIHSGIYYQPDSLKARLCVEGKHALYEYLDQMEVPHKKIGKLIVATSENEIPKLEALKTRAEANGIYDLEWLDQQQVRELEPMIESVNGLFSPSTGIVDSHSLMIALKGDAQRNGAWVQILSPVLEGEVQEKGVALVIGGKDQSTILCRAVINCAGLSSQDVARKIDGLSKESIPDKFFAKGHYFMLKGNSPFSHLVYPVPTEGGLGIHVTLDMEGNTRFGPDVSWVDSVDYSFDETCKKDFLEAIGKYYTSIKEEDLVPGYTGIRSKLVPAGTQDQDFQIQGPKDHGVSGLVNLYGIESPGLTASLAIAKHVLTILEE